MLYCSKFKIQNSIKITHKKCNKILTEIFGWMAVAAIQPNISIKIMLPCCNWKAIIQKNASKCVISSTNEWVLQFANASSKWPHHVLLFIFVLELE